MNDLSFQERFMAALVIMNAAMINLRLYPPTNTLIVNTIDRLHDSMEKLLAERDPVTLAEWERNLLVCGETLTQKNMARPQVAITLMLMNRWGIRSIDFHRGIEKGELSLFLELMNQKDGVSENGASWGQAASLEQLPHITINRKLYVDKAMDALGTDPSEETVAALLVTVRDPAAMAGLEKVRKLATGDPAWLMRTLHTGIEQLIGQGETVSSSELSENLLRMLRSLDVITDPDRKEETSQQVAHELSGLDIKILSDIIQQNTSGIFDDRLFERVVEGLEYGKIEDIIGLLKQRASAGTDSLGAEAVSARQALDRLMATEKGAECIQTLNEKLALERQEEDRRSREIQKRWQPFFNVLDTGCPDAESAISLPGTVSGLLAEGQAASADWLIGQLLLRLANDRADVRNAASRILSRLMGLLSKAQLVALLETRRESFLLWMASETVPTDAYRTLGEFLVEQARQALCNDRLADSLPIIEALKRSVERGIRTEGDVPSMAMALLDGLATADIIKLLIEEFRTNRKGQHDAAGRHLICLARQALNQLLDLLRDSQDTAERILILNLIPEIGPVAIPALVGRLTPEAAWYDLWNLARLLGRVGSEAEAEALVPLLAHDDPRVQREALKSISGIGGNRRGEILLAALPHADDRVKTAVVALLGSLKHKPAVQPLIEMFRVKSAIGAEFRADLEEKICLALGAIGDGKAVPLLTEIDKSSGLFFFKSYSPKVKAAAAKALVKLSATR